MKTYFFKVTTRNANEFITVYRIKNNRPIQISDGLVPVRNRLTWQAVYDCITLEEKLKFRPKELEEAGESVKCYFDNRRKASLMGGFVYSVAHWRAKQGKIAIFEV